MKRVNELVDAAYATTRRSGEPGTVTVLTDTGHSFDEETGEETGGEVTHNIRFMVKEPTKYGRILRSNAVEGNIGEATFTMWLRDTKNKFDRLDGEDYITFDGDRYDVVTFHVENRTSVIVTADQTQRP